MSQLLYLDFDEPESDAVDELEKRIYNVANMVQIEMELVSILPTRRGFHAIVKAEWPLKLNPGITQDLPIVGNTYLDREELTTMETVCLQLLLGSDPKREAFNLLRAHSIGDAPAFWRDRWNVLYAEKITE